MLKNERQDKILEIISKNKYTTVKELTDLLHYSPATIRRDLTVLDSLGLLKKSYGGVSMNTQSPPVVIREHDNTGAKIAICRSAATLIHDGDMVFIDGTTTTYFLCEFLDKLKNVTVVTNNMKLALALGERNIPCYVTGGLVCDTTMLAYDYAADIIEKMNFDIAFFSVSAVNSDGRFSISDYFTGLTRAALKNTKKSVLLFDGSKIKNDSKCFFKSISAIDCVISNIKIPKMWKTKFADTEFISII